MNKTFEFHDNLLLCDGISPKKCGCGFYSASQALLHLQSNRFAKALQLQSSSQRTLPREHCTGMHNTPLLQAVGSTKGDVFKCNGRFQGVVLGRRNCDVHHVLLKERTFPFSHKKSKTRKSKQFQHLHHAISNRSLTFISIIQFVPARPLKIY